MCGLVGVHTLDGKFLTKVQKELFEDLLKFNITRGIDSVGVIFRQKTTYSVVKTVGTTYDLVLNNQYKKEIAKDLVSLHGHNRAATVGGVNKNNAHPFEHGNTVGMHNGTLIGYRGEFSTDSEHIIHLLSNSGPKEVLEGLEGAYALTWVKDNEFYFARNLERPLTCTVIDNLFIYASESWMIKAALIKHNLGKGCKIKEVSIGKVFTIKDGNIVSVCEFTPKKAALDDYWVESFYGRSRTKALTQSYSHPFDGPKGVCTLTYNEFVAKTAQGCDHCGEKGSTLKAHLYSWLDDNTYYCDVCSGL